MANGSPTCGPSSASPETHLPAWSPRPGGRALDLNQRVAHWWRSSAPVARAGAPCGSCSPPPCRRRGRPTAGSPATSSRTTTPSPSGAPRSGRTGGRAPRPGTTRWWSARRPAAPELWELPNSKLVRQLTPASAGGVASARGLAGMHAAAISGPEPLLRPGAFGHSGAAGSPAFVDPCTGLACGRNRRRFAVRAEPRRRPSARSARPDGLAVHTGHSSPDPPPVVTVRIRSNTYLQAVRARCPQVRVCTSVVDVVTDFTL